MAHGYLIRNTLLAWGAEGWANVKWGSIYHALRQLAKEGLMTAEEIAESPGRIDYALTDAGEAEFLRLLREALARPDHRPDLLAAGLALLTALPRAEVIALLGQRLAGLEAIRGELLGQADQTVEGSGPGCVPAQILEVYSLLAHAATGGADWTRELIDRLRAGAYVMADEPAGNR